VTKLSLLSWKGYKSLVDSYEAELRELDLVVEVSEDSNADAIYKRFAPGTEDFDIVIVDWEYSREYERLTLPIPAKYVKLSTYLEPFQDRYLFEAGNRLAFVPVRFGTNGFLYRLEGQSTDPKRFNESLKDMLGSMAQSSRKRAVFAIWDWWLPNLMLLAKAEGYDSPHKMTSKHLGELRNGIMKDFIACARSESTEPIRFKSLQDIITYELKTKPESRKVDWILGPSEMVVAPVCRVERYQHTSESLDWDIPKEGGLVWLETAALSRNLEASKEKREAAYRFLDFLQSEDVQQALICGGTIPDAQRFPDGHWSYPVNNMTGLDHVPKDIKSVFRNKAFEASAREFGKWVADCLDKNLLTMRCLPEDTEPWERLWREVIFECRRA
jgi:spermidine/putrescine-binding protein